MGGVWVAVGILAMVVGIFGVVVVSYIRAQSKRSLRDRTFRAAILEQENKRSRALMVGKDEPDAYIAEREILRLKERYAAGKEFTV